MIDIDTLDDEDLDTDTDVGDADEKAAPGYDQSTAPAVIGYGGAPVSKPSKQQGNYFDQYDEEPDAVLTRPHSEIEGDFSGTLPSKDPNYFDRYDTDPDAAHAEKGGGWADNLVQGVSVDNAREASRGLSQAEKNGYDIGKPWADPRPKGLPEGEKVEPSFWAQYWEGLGPENARAMADSLDHLALMSEDPSYQKMYGDLAQKMRDAVGSGESAAAIYQGFKDVHGLGDFWGYAKGTLGRSLGMMTPSLASSFVASYIEGAGDASGSVHLQVSDMRKALMETGAEGKELGEYTNFGASALASLDATYPALAVLRTNPELSDIRRNTAAAIASRLAQGGAWRTPAEFMRRYGSEILRDGLAGVTAEDLQGAISTLDTKGMAGKDIASEEFKKTLAMLPPEAAMQQLVTTGSIRPKDDSGFIDGVTDPQQYKEFAKGVIPGGIEMGGTALRGAAGVQTDISARAIEFSKRQLAAFDKIDQGSKVQDQDDPVGYQYMDAGQRKQARADLEASIASATLTPVNERSLYRAGKGVSAYAKTVLPPETGYESAVGRQLGEGLGSMVAALPVAYFGVVPSSIFFGASGSGEAVDRAIAYDKEQRAQGKPGLTKEQIANSALWGIAPGATDVAPVEILLGRMKMPAPLRKLGAKAIGRIGGQALVEGIQEGGQQFLQNMIEQEYDRDQSLGEGVASNTAVGGGVGAIAEAGKEFAHLMLKGFAGRKGRGHAEFPGMQPGDDQPRPAPSLSEVLRNLSQTEQAAQPDWDPADTTPYVPVKPGAIEEPAGKKAVDVMQFIRSAGGLQPAGELDTIDAKRYPGLVNKNGLDADKMRERLVENGYLKESGPDEPAVTTPSDVYDLLTRAMGGERIVPAEDAAADSAHLAQMATRDAELELYDMETTSVMPEIAKLDLANGDTTVSEAYARLSTAERNEVIERNARGNENIDDLLEEMAIRGGNIDDIAGLAVRAGATPAEVAEVREFVSQNKGPVSRLVAALINHANSGGGAQDTAQPAGHPGELSQTQLVALSRDQLVEQGAGVGVAIPSSMGKEDAARVLRQAYADPPILADDSLTPLTGAEMQREGEAMSTLTADDFLAQLQIARDASRDDGPAGAAHWRNEGERLGAQLASMKKDVAIDIASRFLSRTMTSEERATRAGLAHAVAREFRGEGGPVRASRMTGEIPGEGAVAPSPAAAAREGRLHAAVMRAISGILPDAVRVRLVERINIEQALHDARLAIARVKQRASVVDPVHFTTKSGERYVAEFTPDEEHEGDIEVNVHPADPDAVSVREKQQKLERRRRQVNASIDQREATLERLTDPRARIQAEAQLAALYRDRDLEARRHMADIAGDPAATVNLTFHGLADPAVHGHSRPMYEVGMVEVDEGFQRRGIASAVYDTIEKTLGVKMQPSGLLYDDGYKFWSARDPEAVRGWQRDDNEGNWISPRQIDLAVKLLRGSVKDLNERKVTGQMRDKVDERLERYQAMWKKVPADLKQRSVLDRMFMLAGRRAVTAPVSTLRAAERMEGRAQTPERIFAETGWFRGPDNEWRFEIDDSQAKINETRLNALLSPDKPAPIKAVPAKRSVFGRLFGGKKDVRTAPLAARPGAQKVGEATRLVNVPLTELLQHAKLYTAYPFLRQMRVDLYWDPRMGDSSGGALITRNRRDRITYLPIRVEAGSAKGMKETLLHEIQHYIQNKEGFSRGSTEVKSENVSGSRAESVAVSRGRPTIYDPHQGRYADNDAKRWHYYEKESLTRSDSRAESLARQLLGLYDELDSSTEQRGERNAQMIEEHIHRLETELEQAMRANSSTYVDSYGEFEAEEVVRRQNMTAAERARNFPLANLPEGIQPSRWQTPSYQEAYDEIMRRAMALRTIEANWAKRKQLDNGVSVVRSDENRLYYTMGKDGDTLFQADLYPTVGGASIRVPHEFYVLPYDQAKPIMDTIARDIRQRNMRPTLEEWQTNNEQFEFWRRYDPTQIVHDPRLYRNEIQEISNREHGGLPVFFASDPIAQDLDYLEAGAAYVMQPGRPLTAEENADLARLQADLDARVKRRGQVNEGRQTAFDRGEYPGAEDQDRYYYEHARPIAQLEREIERLLSTESPAPEQIDISGIMPSNDSIQGVDQDMSYQALAQNALARLGIEGDAMLSVRAFHGSPHDFDKFDLSKIGTGEGAQAFGHGLYFAENPGVAASYQKTLGTTHPIAGKVMSALDMTGGDEEAALRFLKARMAFEEAPAMKGAYREAIERFHDLKNGGSLYEVSLDVEPEQLLDWDRPLGEQDLDTRKLAKLAGISQRDVKALSGKALYDEIFGKLTRADSRRAGWTASGAHTRVQEATAAVLREAGIPGIRYLDRGSRNAGEGSRNIVIFDDSLVKITHKNGTPVTAAERKAVVDQMFALGGTSQGGEAGKRYVMPARPKPSGKVGDTQAHLDNLRLGAWSQSRQSLLQALEFDYPNGERKFKGNEPALAAFHELQGQTQAIVDALAAGDMEAADTALVNSLYAADKLEAAEPSGKSRLFTQWNRTAAKAMGVTEQSGGDSHLSAIKTPKFKRWFGDSKVVDANGAPKVVYHGTANGDFTEFDTYGSRYGLFGQGAYFTENPRIASEYTGKGIVRMRPGQAARTVYPVYLAIKNPINMEAKADAAAWGKAFTEYHDAPHFEGMTNEEAYREMEDTLASEDIPSHDGAEIMQDGLRAMGHDGITHLGGGRVDPDGPKHRVWIAFDPGQIKSATGNLGTFDPVNPHMGYAVARAPLEPNATEEEEQLLALGQADPVAHIISIAMRAVEAESARTGENVETVAGRVVRHEAVELFRALGLITDAEWKLLEAAAKKQGWITPQLRENYTALYGDSMSAEQLEKLLLKEAIADKYGDFHLGDVKASGRIGGIFTRIKEFLVRVANFAKGMGFNRWQDVFTKIDRGELARRYEAKFGTLTPSSSASSSQGSAAPRLPAGWSVVTVRSKDLRPDADPRSTEVHLVDADGKVQYRMEIAKESDGNFYVQYVENQERGHSGLGEVIYTEAAKYARSKGSKLIGGAKLNRTSRAVHERLAARGQTAPITAFDRELTEILPEVASREDIRGVVRAGVLPDAPGFAPRAGVHPVIGLANIIADFRDALAMPVRQGRLDPALKRQASSRGARLFGQYNRATGMTRLAVSNDFDSMTHEAGHHLEIRYGAPLNALMQAHAAELSPMATAIGYNAIDLHEGFAEFFRKYVTVPTSAQTQAPGFFSDFEAMLGRQDPGMLGRLQNIQAAYLSFLTGSPIEIGRANQTVMVGRDGVWSRYIADVQRTGVLDTTADRLHFLYYSTVGKNHGWWLAVKRLLDLTEANTGQRIDIRAFENPNKRLRQAAHTAGWAMEALKFGIPLRSAPNGNGHGMHEVLQTAFGGTQRAQWSEDAVEDFGDYLIARRAVHLYVMHNPALRPAVQAFVAANPQLNYLLARLPNNTVSELERAPTLESLDVQLRKLVDHEARSPQYQQAAEQYYEFNRNILRFLAEKGLISQQDLKKLLLERDYAPFQRDMSDRESITGNRASQRPEVNGPQANKDGVFRAIRGSTRDIINPIQSTTQFVYEMMLRAAFNDTLTTMDRLARVAGPGSGAIFERLPAHDARMRTVQIREALNNAARQAGLSPTDRMAMIGNVESYLGPNATADLFTLQQTAERGERICWFYENGKPVPARMADGTLGQMMFEGFTTLGRRSPDMWMKLLSIPGAVSRFGVTHAWDFVLRNIFVDAFVAPVNSPYARPFLTQAAGMREIMNSGSYYHHMYNRYAGMMGGAMSVSLSDQSIERDVRQLRHLGYKVRRPEGIWDLTKMLLQFGEFSETATRVGVFRNAMISARADGLSKQDAAIEAAHAAHDVMDFSRHGSRTELARRATPFLNAMMQGTDKYIRSLSAQGDRGSAFMPWLDYRLNGGRNLTQSQQRDITQAGKAWFYTIIVFGGMSLLARALADDDDDIDEIPGRIRATHWVFSLNGIVHLLPKSWTSFLPDDVSMRLPKGFETAGVANAVERALDYWQKGDESAFNEYLNDVWEIIKPPTTIPALDLFYGFKHGKEDFNNRDIIPFWEQQLERREQYGPYTTGIAKQIGKAVKVAPYYIDYLARGLGTSVGRDVSTIYDMTAGWLQGKGPAPGIEDFPIARRFSYNTGRSSRSVGEFYDRYRGSEGLNSWFWDAVTSDARSFASAKNTYAELKRGQNKDLSVARDFYERISPDQKVYATLGVDFKGRKSKYRNLHPIEDAADGIAVTNAMMKEVIGGTVATERKGKGEEVKLDRQQMYYMRNELGHIRKAMAQNSLHIMDVPGWSNRVMVDLDKRLNVVKSVSEPVYTELLRRLKEKHYVDPKHLKQVWPEVKSRVLADRDEADLGDLYSGGELTDK